MLSLAGVGRLAGPVAERLQHEPQVHERRGAQRCHTHLEDDRPGIQSSCVAAGGRIIGPETLAVGRA